MEEGQLKEEVVINKERVEDKTKEKTGKELTKKQNVFLVLILSFVGVIFAAVAILLAFKEEKPPNIYSFELNEAVEIGGLEYTFLEYNRTQTYVNPETYNYVYPDNDNNLLVYIRLKVFNPTKSAIYLRDGDWFLSNHKYNYHLFLDDFEYLGKFSDSDAFLISHEKVEPYETINCDLLYEVPIELFNNCSDMYLGISLNKENVKEIYRIKLFSRVGENE